MAKQGKQRNVAILGRGRSFDVIVVGGGPAGSVMAWELARRGVEVIVLDRASFPRDKVCGDYIEPRGLRVFKAMRCLRSLERTSPRRVTRTSIYVDSVCRYRGRIPFYGRRSDLPSHGYIIPRYQLDQVLLQTAARAGAYIRENTAVTGVAFHRTGVEVSAKVGGGKRVSYRARLIVGADGVQSVVARSVHLLVNDPRHTAVSQRAYAEGVSRNTTEAAFYFNKAFFPGYGWMFPMSAGRANIGVGILAEARDRYNINVTELFADFVRELKRSHPLCSRLRLCGSPGGGIVKTYGAAAANHFDFGVLIGDAGSFVDPMTGEGITPAMESAMLAAPVLVKALETGRFDAEFLSAYERAFRDYFDPAMTFLDFCAAILRNRRLGRSVLHTLARGCERARQDPDFARNAGACFGGLELRPAGVLSQVWLSLVTDFATLLGGRLFGAEDRRPSPLIATVCDLIDWQNDWWSSALGDPIWHTAWAVDVSKKWLRVLSILGAQSPDPRAAGLVARRTPYYAP